MASSNDNTSTLSLLMQSWYDKLFLERLTPKFYLTQFASQRSIPKQNGKTITWSIFTNFSAVTALTEGETPTANNTSAANVSATLEQFGSYVIRTDLLGWTEIMGTAQEVIDAFADQADLTIDTRIRDACYGTSSIPTGAGGAFNMHYPASLYAAQSTIVATYNPTLSSVKEVVTKLRASNVPTMDDGFYIFLTHPNVASQLMDDSNWQTWNAQTHADKMYKGEVGNAFGARILESTNVGYSTSGTGTPGTVSAYYSLCFGKDAYAVTKLTGEYLNTYIKTPGPTNTSDPLSQRSTIGWKATFVPQVLNETRGYVVVTGD
jgi:N4-gp56 family major capsid protein